MIEALAKAASRHESQARWARDLVWDHSVDPKDAVHVASALSVAAPIMETYDVPLIGKSGKIGVPPLIIREPPPAASPKFPGF
jgi:hypothetical protein